MPAEPSRDGSAWASADKSTGDSSATVFNLFLGGRPTARASADHREAETPAQAQGDNLTRPRLAGHTHRQVYYTENRHTSAKLLGTRRGSRSAACAGWAAFFDWSDSTFCRPCLCL